MRFLGDVPIARATLEFLRAQGHDCLSTRSRLPANAPDTDIVRLATDEDRIILCFDLDFAAIVAVSRARRPSVVTLRLTRRNAAAVNERLASVIPNLGQELADGVLVAVEDHRVRVRRLPVLR